MDTLERFCGPFIKYVQIMRVSMDGIDKSYGSFNKHIRIIRVFMENKEVIVIVH